MSYHTHPDRQAGGPSTSTSTWRAGSINEGSHSTLARGGAAARGHGGRGGGGRTLERGFDSIPTGEFKAVRVGFGGMYSLMKPPFFDHHTGSVSKLKAQLRQTKRLLARPDLTPDVRTTTERRLDTLESELVAAQEATLEKKMVVRYKGVRFFERQKCLRKIRQALKANPNSNSTTSSSSKALFDARADLYYVLHFPSKEKYIALFPEGQYVPFVEVGSMELNPSGSGSERKRWELRNSYRRLLKEGKVGMEVEKGVLGIVGEQDQNQDQVEKDGEGEEVDGQTEERDEDKVKIGKRGRVEDDEEGKTREGKKRKSPKVGDEAPKEGGKKKNKGSTTTTTKKESVATASKAAVASAPKTAPASNKPTDMEPSQPMSKKDRKAEKDARRKATKEGSQTKVTKEDAKPKGWARDDNFFA
ncbi:BQ2448_1001 [Microbotryum intermedium]|uniref:rRNA-processing protein EFG1 n=1 Tax=Microbotryum intermedium TaxID=269621 RepID=A0A238F4H1_9BASI|nr:BQ2448_1001 [Microbotryum intermedium]